MQPLPKEIAYQVVQNLAEYPLVTRRMCWTCEAHHEGWGHCQMKWCASFLSASYASFHNLWSVGTRNEKKSSLVPRWNETAFPPRRWERENFMMLIILMWEALKNLVYILFTPMDGLFLLIRWICFIEIMWLINSKARVGWSKLANSNIQASSILVRLPASVQATRAIVGYALATHRWCSSRRWRWGSRCRGSRTMRSPCCSCTQ